MKLGDQLVDLSRPIQSPAIDEYNRNQHRIWLEKKRKGQLGLARRTWTPEELEQVIMLKINERLKSNNGAVFQAFRLFNEDGGTGDASIEPEEFRSVLSKLLQCTMSWEEVKPLFDKYDRDGSGDIDIYEFIDGIMKPFGTPATLAGDLRDINADAGAELDYNNYKPPCSPPPKVERPATGVNKMLNARDPPRQDPSFQPSSRNRHPNANMLRATTPGGGKLAECSTRGVVSDAEREMLENLPNLMKSAYMFGNTQAMRKRRFPKDSDGNEIECTPQKPWTPFRLC